MEKDKLPPAKEPALPAQSMEFTGDYKIFEDFIKKYLPCGFTCIDPDDDLMRRIDDTLRARKQFFYIGDLIKLKILFASSGTRDLFGIPPEELDPATFYVNTHPEDMARHNLGRTKLFNLGQNLFFDQTSDFILSSNFRFKNITGAYSSMLVQCFLFSGDIPQKTVYLLQLTSDISHFKMNKHGYHYYIGKDMTNFRYPDLKLLRTGNIFTEREFQVLKGIAEGLDSSQIAKKYFLSVHTVNTHRRNILKKSGKTNTHDLVIELKERGVI